MSRITNLVWSFYHYVAWYGFRKGIIRWIREWNSEEEEAKQQAKIFCFWIKNKQVECRFPKQIRSAWTYNEQYLLCLCCLLGRHLEQMREHYGGL
jgi:hypothetical protein